MGRSPPNRTTDYSKWKWLIHVMERLFSPNLPSPGHISPSGVPAQMAFGQLSALRRTGERHYLVPHTLLGEWASQQGWLHTPGHTQHLADPNWARQQRFPRYEQGKWPEHAAQLTYNNPTGKQRLKFCSCICKPWANLTRGPWDPSC